MSDDKAQGATHPYRAMSDDTFHQTTTASADER